MMTDQEAKQLKSRDLVKSVLSGVEQTVLQVLEYSDGVLVKVKHSKGRMSTVDFLRPDEIELTGMRKNFLGLRVKK